MCGSHTDEASPPHLTLLRGYGGAQPRGLSADPHGTSGARHGDGAREKRCEQEALLALVSPEPLCGGHCAQQGCTVGPQGRRSG